MTAGRAEKIFGFILGLLLLPGVALAQNDIINTVAGGGPNNLAPTSANLDQPTSVAVDATGNIYIASPKQHRIFKVDPPGNLSVAAGDGTPGFAGDKGIATTFGKLNSPNGVAVDSSGSVIIADTGNNRIRKVDTSGNITTIAGNGAFGFSGDGGPATLASLAQPSAVAADSKGNLFIVDGGNQRVRKIDTSGNISTVAGSGAAGFGGDGGPATSALLNNPSGVAVDAAGNFYIADSGNQRVRKVSSGVITTFAGGGTTSVVVLLSCSPSSCTLSPIAATSPALSSRLGVGVSTGTPAVLYVADADDELVLKVDSSGNLSVAAGNGNLGFLGDGGAATAARLASPLSVTVDVFSNIFIADTGNRRVREVSGGIINTKAGNGQVGFSGDGSPATQASLNSPQGVATDSLGNIFIADTLNNRVRKMLSSGNITTVAGNGTAGFSGDGGAAVATSLNSPTGVAVDAAGDVFIADTSNQRVRKRVPASGAISTFAGNGTAGFNGDGSPPTSFMLNFPSGVAVDTTGNVFIADRGNHCVRKVDAAGTTISTVAGMCTKPGFGGDAGPATTANLNFPSGVAVDGSGNVYIADTNNQRIRRVGTNGNITTVAGNGAAGFSGDGGPATSAALNTPFGVAVDGAGNLFIADQFNQAIRRVDASTGVITTVAGNGSLGFSGDGGLATSGSLASPAGVATDSSGNLVIGDTLNNRVRRVTNPVVPAVSLSPKTLSFGNQVLGTTSALSTVTLKNTGNTILNISGIATSGDFGQTNNCGTSLAAGANCTISVTFTPTTVGPETGTLTITDDAPGSPQTVPLSGAGVPPPVTLSPSSLSFANQLVGTTSTAQTVTVTNSGTATLNISGIAVTGANSSDFTISSNACGASVTVGANCTFGVALKPTATGTRTASVTITDDAFGSPQVVALTGTGVAPAVALAPTSISFQNQGVGTTSSPTTISLTNTGNADLSITSITTSGDFAQSNDCGSTVTAPKTCSIKVTFSPTATGSRTGTLTITDNALNSPQTVALSGTGVVAYSLVADRTSATVIKTVDSATFSIAPRTDFGFSGSISLSCSGNSPANCSFSPSSITPGQSSTLTVSNLNALGSNSLAFTVTGTSGSQSASLSLTILIADFSLSVSPGSVTITAGQSATYQLAIAPTNGFNQPISFSCSGAPAASTCSVGPNPAIPDGTNPANATATVTTAALLLTQLPPPFAPHQRNPSSHLPVAAWIAVLAAFVASQCVSRRRIRLVGAMSLVLISVSVACGVGGGARRFSGTPSGTFTLTLTATSSSLTHTINLTLTVR